MTQPTPSPADGTHALILVENMSVPSDRRVWAEARALAAAGYRVSVICPRGKTRDTATFEALEGIEIHRFPLREAGGGPWGYLVEYGSALRHLRRLAKHVDSARRVDVVHLCNPPDVLFLAVGRLRRRGVPVVFDHHDLVPELYEARFGKPAGLLYRAARLFERQTFRRADVVVSPNESYKRIAIERGGKRPEDVFVVRIAPDVDRFRAGEPDPELARGKPHLIAYVGTMGPQDGVDHAVRALAALAERRTDWHAVLGGDGDAAAEAKALAADLGLGDLVDFPGFLDDAGIVRLLSTADACLAPEPLNALNDASTMIKVVEYMAFARPVVAYDLTETRRSAGEAGLYAEPSEPTGLADALDRLLDDPELRGSLGRTGRGRVEGELSWEVSRAALEAAYARACAAARRS